MKHKGTIQKVISLVQRLQPGMLPVIFFTRVISSGHPFVNLIFSAKILDMVIRKETMESIMAVVWQMVLIEAVIAVTRWGLEKIIIIKKRVLSEQVYQMICEKTLVLDYEVLERKETLEMIQRAEEGMNSHGDLGSFCDELGQIVDRICSIVYSVALLIPLFISVATDKDTLLVKVLNSPFSVLLPLVAVMISLLAATRLQKWMQGKEQVNFERNVKLNRTFSYFFSFIWDYAQGKYIRLYDMQDMIMEEVRNNQAQVEGHSREMIVEMRKSGILEAIVMLLLQITSYVYIGLKATLGLISVGNVLKYIGAFQQFYMAVQSLTYSYVNMELRSKYLSYFYDFMELKNQKYDGTLPIEKRDDNEYVIEFKDVSFHYPNSEEMVLNHVNTQITLGGKTAVVGKNGAGKSTFIKLLCRLYDPTEGQILLNGIDIKLYDYEEYIRLFSVVFQDFQLFSASLAENVAASKEYVEQRVVDCLEQAGFGKRLAQMPEGIRTNIYQVEDNGVEISGGEAQKVAIARALYKDAPFVILDEPTSALDPVSEYEIYQHFNELVEDKTAIYISHRMSSCRFCDKIYVFDQGQIVQVGNHDQLMQHEDGIYHRLWEAQAQYYQQA